MRNISKGLREQRAKQLTMLIGNYEKALKTAKSRGDSAAEKNLESLIKKAKKDLNDLK